MSQREQQAVEVGNKLLAVFNSELKSKTPPLIILAGMLIATKSLLVSGPQEQPIAVMMLAEAIDLCLEDMIVNFLSSPASESPAHSPSDQQS